MFQEILLASAVTGGLTFAALKHHQNRHYHRLLTLQEALNARYGTILNLPSRLPAALPDFQQRLALIPEPLPPAAFAILQAAALRYGQTERSYFPAHKKGGTIGYKALFQTAPEIVALYQSDFLRRLCAAVIGEAVLPTPINDQSSCSLLFYDQPRDHIGWHYDHNFYNGRHFTLLLPLINRHLAAPRLSSAQLVIRRDDQEITIPTPPNTLIVFEGAKVLHKVTRLEEQELRIILSMTFCTQPQASVFKGTARRFKDIAYFGIRALWT